MNKKILLSTILASSILSSNNAFAAGTITYSGANNGVYTLKFEGTTYNSLVELGAAIKQRATNGEKFEFDTVSDQKIQGDILNAIPTLMADLAKGITKLTGTVVTAGSVTDLAEVLRDLKSNGYNAFEAIELNDIFDLQADDIAEMKDIFKVIEMLEAVVEVATGVNKLADENQALVNQLAAKDSEIAKLVAQKKQLPANDTAGETAVNQKIMAAVLATPEGKSIKNSPQGQENLKQAVDALSNLSVLSKDKAVNFNLVKEKANLYLSDAATTAAADLPQVQKSDTHTANSLVHSSITTSNIITDRVSGFTGIASGEAFQTFGAWIKGSFSQGEQKGFKSEPGFKFNQKGVTIGVDTGDESMIGIAGSFFKNDVSNKSSSSAKDKMDTYLGSIYGMHSFSPELFLSAQVSYGKSNIKKNRATGDLANNKATAKTKGTLMGGRAEVGYVYPLNNETQVVPSLGFAYNKVDVKGYSEKGSGLNRTVGKITSNRTSGLAGVALRHVADMGTMKVMPEIHANMDYAFSGKSSATKINLGGVIDLTTPSEKTSKAFYNLGASVKVGATEMVDVTAGYDLGLSKKFISHTGALKLRVNF